MFCQDAISRGIKVQFFNELVFWGIQNLCMGAPACSHHCPGQLRAAMVSWCFFGQRWEGHIPGLHLQRSSACFPEDELEWMQVWPQSRWSGHIPWPDQLGLQAIGKSSPGVLLPPAPHLPFAGEKWDLTGEGSTLDVQLQPLLAPAFLLVQFSVERPEVRTDQ